MILDILHVTLGIAFGFFIPGLIISTIFFKKLNYYDRITIGIGLSLCIDILFGFVLLKISIGGVPLGLTEKNIWMSLLSLSFIGIIILFIQNKGRNGLDRIKPCFEVSYSKIFVLLSLMMLIFLTRFLVYVNNPYAGDAYEFKSLYIANQIIQTGYINENIPLSDHSYKFYTGMIVDDTLHNEGHPIFLSVIQLLTKIPLEILRRLSLTTVLLVFPLFSLYRLIMGSSKAAPFYVLTALLYFENLLVVSGKTSNITLAWYLSLFAIYLMFLNKNRILPVFIALAIQILLFFTYKTSAISLIPVLITIIYGKVILNIINLDKIITLNDFLKRNIVGLILSSAIIVTSVSYYFYFYPLIIRVFLESIISPLPSSLLNFISIFILSNGLLFNFFIFIFIYLFYYFTKEHDAVFKKIKISLKRLRMPIFILYSVLLLFIVVIYVNGLKSGTDLISPSNDLELILRIINIFIFMEFFAISLLYYQKLLPSSLNKLVFYWIIGSIALFPIWYIWGGTYGFVLRTVVVLLFPGSLVIAGFIERNILVRCENKIIILALIVFLILPTVYYMATINNMAKGAINMSEYFGLKWVSMNVDKEKVIYSDLKIAGALVPVSNYTHIQLKGPNDFNGDVPYEGTNIKEELNSVWYTDSISTTTKQVLTYRNVNYLIQSDSYYKEGIMASNFFYKPMDNHTKHVYESSDSFNEIYSNGKLWVYSVR
jgi:hypothetical protein